MLSRALAAWIVFLAATSATTVGAVSFTGIYAFGDSLTDTGNICAAPCPLYPVPPYAAGRFSNGPVWIEGVAAGLGLSVSPSFYGGNNYAVGGATSAGVLGSQVPSFLSSVGGVADPTALYVLWAGGNDGLSGGSATTAATNIVNSISSLHLAGAGYFLVANLPDLSLTPQALGNPLAQLFSVNFNASLAAGLASLTGVTVFEFDVYAATNDAVANPGSYGYTNVNTRCWNWVTVCANPNQYLFWDGIHPTTAAHSLTASGALLAIPEPGTGSLVLLGLLVLASRQGRLASE